MNDTTDTTSESTATAGGATTEPTTPPPLLRPARRVYRSRLDRKIGGVCGGLGQYFGIDPTLVRLGFAISLFTGIGFFAYIIAWIVLPEGEQTTGPTPRGPGEPFDRNTAIAIGLIAVAVLLAAATGPFGWGEGVLLPLVLVGAGIYLLSQRPLDSSPSALPPQAAVDDRPPPPSWTALADDPTPPAYGTAYAPPPPPPPEPAFVTRITLSVLALFVAGAIVAEATGWIDVSLAPVVGIGLAIVGAGLLAGAFLGGSRGLIPLGIVGTLVLVPVAALAPTFDDGVGERLHEPTTLDELRDEYRLGIGELVVDLSDLDLDGQSRTVEVHLGVGSARVLVPDDVEVTATADIDVGDALVFGRHEEGIRNDVGPVTRDGEPGAGSLTIDLEVGFGEGRIER